jgi:hypothetical protein
MPEGTDAGGDVRAGIALRSSGVGSKSGLWAFSCYSNQATLSGLCVARSLLNAIHQIFVCKDLCQLHIIHKLLRSN